MANELQKGQVIQMWEGEPQKSAKQFPISVSGAIMHGDGKTIDQEIEAVKAAQSSAIENAEIATHTLVELKEEIKKLPDGQAVSVQVAENTLAIERLDEQKAEKDEVKQKMPLGGKDPRAWVGMADQLAPSEKTEQAAYRDEVLPAGRILGYAPELGPSGAGTRDGQIADSVSPVMREVSGVSGGANQLVPENGGSVNLEASTTSNRKPYLHMSNGTAVIIRVDAAETRSFSKGDIVVDVRKAMPTLNTFLNTITIAPEQVAHKLGFLALQRD